jgi:hypothetical protein
MQGKSDFIDSLITKELLIQESQREGIDKEEPFRRSIQNFYEQSLMKLLMDRKFASLQVSVGDEEVNSCVWSAGKKFHLTIFSFDNVEEANKSKYQDGESRSMYFEDIAGDIRSAIVRLKQGEMTAPVKSGDKYIVIRLDKVEPAARRTLLPSEVEKIKKMLTDEKKQQMIDDWIAGLRKKASVKILLDGKNQEGK